MAAPITVKLLKIIKEPEEAVKVLKQKLTAKKGSDVYYRICPWLDRNSSRPAGP